MSRVRHLLGFVLLSACATDDREKSPDPRESWPPWVLDFERRFAETLHLDGLEQRAADAGGRHLILRTTAVGPGGVHIRYVTTPTGDPEGRSNEHGQIDVAVRERASPRLVPLGTVGSARANVEDRVDLHLWSPRWAWEYRMVEMRRAEPADEERQELEAGCSPPTDPAAIELTRSVAPELVDPLWCTGGLRQWRGRDGIVSRALRDFPTRVRFTGGTPGSRSLPPRLRQLLEPMRRHREAQSVDAVRVREARAPIRVAVYSHPDHAASPTEVELRAGDLLWLQVERDDTPLADLPGAGHRDVERRRGSTASEDD